MDEIFESFATAISDLVLVALENKEANNTPQPELLDHIDATGNACDILSSTAMDMVEGFRREELKEKLKEAANNVSSTKKQLAEASAILREGSDLPTGWEMLVAGCKGMGKETSALLTTVSNAPIRSIKLETFDLKGKLQELDIAVEEGGDTLLTCGSSLSSHISYVISACNTFSVDPFHADEEKLPFKAIVTEFQAKYEKIVAALNEVLNDSSNLEKQNNVAILSAEIAELADRAALEVSAEGEDPFSAFEQNLEARLKMYEDARRKRLSKCNDAIAVVERQAGVLRDLTSSERPKHEHVESVISHCSSISTVMEDMDNNGGGDEVKPQELVEAANSAGQKIIELFGLMDKSITAEVGLTNGKADDLIVMFNASQPKVMDLTNSIVADDDRTKRAELVIELSNIAENLEKTAAVLAATVPLTYSGVAEEIETKAQECRGLAYKTALLISSAIFVTPIAPVNDIVNSINTAIPSLQEFVNTANDFRQIRNVALAGYLQAAMAKVNATAPSIGSAVNDRIKNAEDGDKHKAFNNMVASCLDLANETITASALPSSLCFLPNLPKSRAERDIKIRPDPILSFERLHSAIETAKIEIFLTAKQMRKTVADYADSLLEGEGDKSILVALANQARKGSTGLACIGEACVDLSTSDRTLHSQLIAAFNATLRFNCDMTASANLLLSSPTAANLKIAEAACLVVNEALATLTEESSVEPSRERQAEEVLQNIDEDEKFRLEAAAVHRVALSANHLTLALSSLAEAEKDDPTIATRQAEIAARSATFKTAIMEAERVVETECLREAVRKLKEEFANHEKALAAGLSLDEEAITPEQARIIVDALSGPMNNLDTEIARQDVDEEEEAARIIEEERIQKEEEERVAAEEARVEAERVAIEEARVQKEEEERVAREKKEQEEKERIAQIAEEEERKKQEEEMALRKAEEEKKREEEEALRVKMEEEAEKQRQEEKMKRDAEKKKEEERKAKEVEMRAQAKAEKEEEERLAKEAEEAEAVEEIVVGEVPALEAPMEKHLEHNKTVIEAAVAQHKQVSKIEMEVFNSTNSVSDAMALMAEAFTNKNREAFMKAAKAINEHVNTAIAQTKESIKGCGNVILVKQAISNVQALKNFNVQLKIIASVKAASITQDVQDDNSQLVSACGGLSRAMAEMVNSVHSVQVAKRGKDSTEGDTLVNTFFKKVTIAAPAPRKKGARGGKLNPSLMPRKK